MYNSRGLIYGRRAFVRLGTVGPCSFIGFYCRCLSMLDKRTLPRFTSLCASGLFTFYVCVAVSGPLSAASSSKPLSKTFVMFTLSLHHFGQKQSFSHWTDPSYSSSDDGDFLLAP